MKRKTTKELLVESFREVAEEKAINKITIKDITGNCGYSPATFYRQFRDKYDLIAWAYSRDLEQIMDQIAFDKMSWKQIVNDAANYYNEHKEYLANLFLHTSGYDAFIRNMTEINYSSLKKRILQSAGLENLDEKTEMLIRTYIFGSVHLSCEWILGKHHTTPKDLAEVYELALPEPLRQYLY